MLVTMETLLKDAREKQYCVPGFDVSNYEMIKAVLDVCEEERSPALFMCLKPDMVNKGIHFIAAMIKEAAKHYTIPICLHLDHATEMADIQEAIAEGFTSVMYDGSVLPFEQNAANTKAVVDYAHAHGVSVEAELGHVGDGIAGNNDGTAEEADAADHPEDGLTDPEDVARFIEITDVDALAVAVGTVHGVYRGTPELRFDRLEAINKISKKPLVLHGGSGTPDELMQKAISLGICKINIYSEVLNALNSGLKQKLNSIENLSMWPCYVYEIANQQMRDVIRHKIRTFGSAGRV